MSKYHADNERMKRKYFIFLKEAKRQDDASVDAVAKAISRFEEYKNGVISERFILSSLLVSNTLWQSIVTRKQASLGARPR